MGDNDLIEFSVFVEHSETGQPVPNVTVYFDAGVWHGGERKYTDESGHAYFSIPASGHIGSISVDGWDGVVEVGEYSISDGDSFSAQYP